MDFNFFRLSLVCAVRDGCPLLLAAPCRLCAFARARSLAVCVCVCVCVCVSPCAISGAHRPAAHVYRSALVV